MEIKVKIQNLEQIKAAFAMSPRVMAKNLNRAIKRASLKVEGTSKRYTPVDTGRLRGSHYTRFSNLKGIIGTNTSYDLFVHEGTRFMKGRPFLRGALNVEDNFIQNEFERAVSDTLKEIARSAP